MKRYVIDIGNTRIKTGAFSERGTLLDVRYYGEDDWGAIHQQLTNLGVGKIIYSSVAKEPPAEWLQRQSLAGRQCWALDPTAQLPYQSDYLTPTTLGKDRVAALAGCRSFFPDRNCLVVDAGTCVTSDLLTAEGVFRGGNISPGLSMRLRSMHFQTARLPLVAPAKLEGVLGNSTETAMRQGGQGGLVYELEGLYQRLVAEWSPLHVVLTGGDADRLLPYLRLPYTVKPHLVLYGLNKIMTLYAEQTV